MYLAYLAAITHGLTEHAERLKPLIQAPGLEIPEAAPAGAKLMQPPTPIIRTKDGGEKEQGLREEDGTVNWPQLTVPKSAFEGTLAENEATGLAVSDEMLGEAAGDAWDDELDFGDDGPGMLATPWGMNFMSHTSNVLLRRYFSHDLQVHQNSLSQATEQLQAPVAGMTNWTSEMMTIWMWAAAKWLPMVAREAMTSLQHQQLVYRQRRAGSTIRPMPLITSLRVRSRRLCSS